MSEIPEIAAEDATEDATETETQEGINTHKSQVPMGVKAYIALTDLPDREEGEEFVEETIVEPITKEPKTEKSKASKLFAQITGKADEEDEEEEEEEQDWGACADEPPTSTVEVNISCRDLKNLDLISLSDPMCVVYIRPAGMDEFQELMRTETIENDLNPNFMTKLTIEYRFEERQLMRFEIYDVDKESTDLSKHQFIGFCECTLANIVSSGPSGFTKILSALIGGKQPKKQPGDQEGSEENLGFMVLVAEELASLKDEIFLKFEGSSMGKKDCFCIAPKVFYVLSRMNEAKQFLIVHRSEPVQGVNPKWSSLTIPLRRLCNGDRELGLKIEAFLFNPNGKHKSLGFCYLSVNKMVSMGTGGVPLTSPSGGASNSTLIIMACKIHQIFTFVDFIQSGTQINCCVSIDFTSSNGDPRDRNSLHYFSPNSRETNPYVQAVEAVISIIQDYDTDKQIPVYGFGAKIPPHRQISHNFFVSLTEEGYCNGLQDIIDKYRACVSKIELYGPTNFTPVIRHVSDMAKKSLNGDHYYILLIITDGVITDMAQTKEAIVEASELPISIIIIGVGGEDFDEMDELDGDKQRLSSKGKVCTRDIVQFIPYRDSTSWLSASVGKANLSLDKTQRLAQEKLAENVLSEIPDQLTSYMKSKSLTPGNVEKNFIQRKDSVDE